MRCERWRGKLGSARNSSPWTLSSHSTYGLTPAKIQKIPDPAMTFDDILHVVVLHCLRMSHKSVQYTDCPAPPSPGTTPPSHHSSRLERNNWLMVERLRQATNEYSPFHISADVVLDDLFNDCVQCSCHKYATCCRPPCLCQVSHLRVLRTVQKQSPNRCSPVC